MWMENVTEHPYFSFLPIYSNKTFMLQSSVMSQGNSGPALKISRIHAFSTFLSEQMIN